MKSVVKCLKTCLIVLLAAACSKPPENVAEPVRVDLPVSPGINVLVISFDAFRADNLKAYGNRSDVTPNLDRFTDESIVFRNAYVAGQATPSSFAAAFTGIYPFRVFRGWKLLKTQTLAGVFAKGGYTTAAFLNNKQLVASRHYNQGFETYSVFRDQKDERPVKEFGAFLQANQDHPFFAWVHFINPHSPYQVRKGSESFYSDGYTGEYANSSGAHVQTYRPDEMKPEDVERIKQLYRGEAHYVDGQFQKVIDRLRSLDLLNRTVILVTADHGEALAQHGVIGHHQLYEEVLRVPMVLRYPGAQPRVVATRVINVDLLPSLATMAGLEYSPDGLDGVNWLNGIPPDRPLLTTQMTNKAKLSMTIRKGDYKFISWCTEKEGFREELFNLATDPGETSNLVDVGEHVKNANDLYDTMVDMAGGPPCQQIGLAIAGGDITDVDEDTLEALRSLGYIQ